jgi:hypothetical protein
MTLSEFIDECDAFSAEFGVSRRWLSKRLFSDTFRLDSLAAGKSDVGILRLAKARTTLAALRVERDGAHDAPSAGLPGTTAAEVVQ